jgi:hypothetical protein
VYRILAHHTEGTVTCLPAALDHFDARAFIAAREQDYVLRMRPAGNRAMSYFPPPHELDLLNRLGFGPDPSHVIDVLVGREGRGIEFRNPSHRSIVENGWLDIFSGTSIFQRTALERMNVQTGLPTLGACCRGNDKSALQLRHGPCWVKHGDGHFRFSQGNSTSLLPYGGHALRGNLDELLGVLQTNKPTHYLIKPATAASCIGLRVVDGDFVDSVFSDIEWLGTTRAVNRFVVQELMPHDMDFSLEFEIPEPGDEGSILIRTICGQHVIDGNFQGNYFPMELSDEMRQVASQAVETIITDLRVNGRAWGSGSVDFIGDSQTGKVWAVEVNLRKTAAYYGRQPMRQRFGQARPFDMRSFSVPRGFSMEAMEMVFNGLLFGQPGSEIGFVPFCFLPDLPGERHGMSYGVCYAPTADELSQLSSDVEARKEALSYF